MHFIFEIHMKPGYPPEQYAKGWVRASKLIQRFPGAQGTRLHRKIGEPDVLLAIATWESKDIRDEMEGGLSDEVRAIIEEQSPFVDIRFIGEYEAPEWEVIPPVID